MRGGLNVGKYIAVLHRLNNPKHVVKIPFTAESKIKAWLWAQRYAKYNSLVLLDVTEVEDEEA